METPEEEKLLMNDIPAKHNEDMKEIIKQLKNISQELHTLNRTLKQRR